MPRALLFQQVFEAAKGLFQVVLRRALDSRDYIVWLAVRTRVVVVVATPLIPIVVIVFAARVVIALAAKGVVLDVCLIFFVGP
jgi:hypothetical protein